MAKIYKYKIDLNTVRRLYWGKSYNAKEIAKRLDVSTWALYDFMSRHNIPRRSYSEANYLVNKDKPKFRIKEILNSKEEKLKIAGIMLYWAEGTFTGCTVDFANSNPQMIQIFLKFLRNICGVSEERLRVYLYVHSCKNLKKVKMYWHKITGIVLDQFTKPYIRKGNPNLSKRKLPYGLVHIRYNDKRLLEKIKLWVEEYINGCVVRYQSGQMDQTVENCSVSKKFEMEKQVNSGKPKATLGNPEPSPAHS